MAELLSRVDLAERGDAAANILGCVSSLFLLTRNIHPCSSAADSLVKLMSSLGVNLTILDWLA
ncbi:hypothetical protein VHEMI01308 [[Torrubiella] hemipterigena]|uniref:Uncharacterized protein n=1 Tax=[Torrubiella] hemipterigena TaxID=1531966 RepID=A0A0A1T775_9HYPO|nr:hypothetical protein VHEMI01308 [[Torrubiella] hemipterigena]